MVSPSSPSYGYLVLKLDSSGQLVESLVFAGATPFELKDTVTGANDELFLLGYSDSSPGQVMITCLSSLLQVDQAITVSIPNL